ncbi:hypothetical protein [Haloterrigena salinisoli]|uniref:hypothetical protein n=1 Tax=Haloterrigena salinisoli TaxID=3132747 RepID=UPI0030D4460F
MRRRKYIVVLGASIPVAGCLSEIKAAGPNANESRPDGTETDTNTRDDSDTETSDEAFGVGNTTGEANPHKLTVQNDGDRSWTIALRITDAETDETLVERSYSLGGREDINGELRGPAEYRVTVTVPDTGTEHVRKVGYFDTCNDYRTTVTISPDGTVTSDSIRTEAGCGV